MGDAERLNIPPSTHTESFPIHREEVEEEKSEKKGKSAGVDNIPGEPMQAGGEAMIDALHVRRQVSDKPSGLSRL